MEQDKNPHLKTDLLSTVLDIIQGQRGKNINELISLLALSNLLGIISFLNIQDLQFDLKSSSSKYDSSELKDMISSLLASMSDLSSDKKINPAMLMNLMKAFSSDNSSENKKKNSNSDKVKE
ncbi:MAG TPA: hypothetical protein GX534_01815 [Thermoanaerobacterales bacterium]|nr:hypothetical protein [Thermoanaerobacterales bacterium]